MYSHAQVDCLTRPNHVLTLMLYGNHQLKERRKSREEHNQIRVNIRLKQAQKQAAADLDKQEQAAADHHLTGATDPFEV